jgi:hypothetical protein
VTTTPEDYRLALSQALDLGTGAPWDVIRDRVNELHRAANGSQLPERPCHRTTLRREVHRAHVYRVQRSESYWCPGLAEPDDDEMAHGPYTVAYGSRIGTGVLFCLEHAPAHPERDLDWMALTAGDLEDGGICSVCGRDVLIQGGEDQP